MFQGSTEQETESDTHTHTHTHTEREREKVADSTRRTLELGSDKQRIRVTQPLIYNFDHHHHG